MSQSVLSRLFISTCLTHEFKIFKEDAQVEDDDSNGGESGEADDHDVSMKQKAMEEYYAFSNRWDRLPQLSCSILPIELG